MDTFAVQADAEGRITLEAAPALLAQLEQASISQEEIYAQSLAGLAIAIKDAEDHLGDLLVQPLGAAADQIEAAEARLELLLVRRQRFQLRRNELTARPHSTEDILFD